MTRHRNSTVTYNARPDFPNEVIQRYPSLTLALGDNYPTSPTSSEWGSTPFDIAEYSSDCDMPGASSNSASSSITASPFTPPADTRIFSHNYVPLWPSSSNDTNDQRLSESRSGFSPIFQEPFAFSPQGEKDLEMSPVHDLTFGRTNFIPISTEPPGKGRQPEPGMISTRKARSSHDAPMSIPPKPYMCAECGKRFTRPCDLKTHRNTHTNEKPFACPASDCSQEFGVRSNMLRHRSTVHGFPRAGKSRPVAPFALRFEEPTLCPTVHSDTSAMRFPIAWNSDGPFSKRQTQ